MRYAMWLSYGGEGLHSPSRPEPHTSAVLPRFRHSHDHTFTTTSSRLRPHADCAPPYRVHAHSQRRHGPANRATRSRTAVVDVRPPPTRRLTLSPNEGRGPNHNLSATMGVVLTLAVSFAAPLVEAHPQSALPHHRHTLAVAALDLRRSLAKAASSPWRRAH